MSDLPNEYNPVFPSVVIHTIERYVERESPEDVDLENIKNWLLSGSADVNAMVLNGSGSGILNYILMGKPSLFTNDATELIQLLVAHGADARQADNVGWTPLHWCTHVGEAVALLDAGADIDAMTFSGDSDLDTTPLQKAIQRDEFDVAQLLIRRGADLELMPSNTSENRHIYHKPWVEHHTRLARREIWQLIDDVKAAGGWKSYVRAPRVELVRLRLLCARGRARPPSSKPILARLFGAPGSSKKSTRASKLASRPLPKEVFWHVLSYWRTIRDDYY